MTTGNVRRASGTLRLSAACIVAFVAAIASPAAKGATTWLVSFAIDNGYAVQNDGKGDYIDYRLTSGQESDPNFCVEASPYSDGSLFVRLNRKLDGDAGYMHCDTPAHDYSQGTQRQFSLVIDAESACAELYSTGYIAQLTTPCTITGGPNPRIRAGDLWARKPTGPTAFLTTNPDPASAITYEVRLDSPATVSTVASSESKVASYGGTAHLYKFGDTTTGAVADAFHLAFHMTFTRTAQR